MKIMDGGRFENETNPSVYLWKSSRNVMLFGALKKKIEQL